MVALYFLASVTSRRVRAKSWRVNHEIGNGVVDSLPIRGGHSANAVYRSTAA
jgi:hypothetical protein